MLLSLRICLLVAAPLLVYCLLVAASFICCCRACVVWLRLLLRVICGAALFLFAVWGVWAAAFLYLLSWEVYEVRPLLLEGAASLLVCGPLLLCCFVAGTAPFSIVVVWLTGAIPSPLDVWSDCDTALLFAVVMWPWVQPFFFCCEVLPFIEPCGLS
jgi:hypothetical protein